jgi:hypothetical protein
MILAATALLSSLLVFLNISSLFAVNRINVAGPFAQRLGQVSPTVPGSGVTVFRYDRDDLAQRLLASEHVERVTVTMDFPDEINALVNQFEPVALVLTDKTYGIDRYCRLLPLDAAWEKLDLPVLTGLKCRRMFEAPRDYRVAGVIAGLLDIEERLPRLYRQIAEIDFSDHVYVVIHLTTGSGRFRAQSRDFAVQLDKLDIIVNSGTRSEGGCYNLIYDDVVIKER